MNEPYIPQKTADKMNEAHPKGTRHKAMLDIAVSLIGNGLSEQAVFSQLRGQFAEDVKDSEIENVVNWASRARPSKSGFGTFQKAWQPSQKTRKEIKQTPREHALWWLGSFSMTIEKMIASSPVVLEEKQEDRLEQFFNTVYDLSENLNIVCAFTESDGRANPSGGGKTMTAGEWLAWIDKDGIPQSKAGAWLRMNPCKPVGSGSGGATTDADIESFRHLLVEFDNQPLEIQLAIYSKLKLPVSAVILSGGKSAHAWIKIGAKDKTEYTESSKRIMEALAPFGVDAANKNPGRLSRLPGAIRTIGASGSGEQTLVYLNRCD